MAECSNERPTKPAEPTHQQIYERVAGMNEDLHSVQAEVVSIKQSLHNIELTMVALKSTVEERGRQLTANERKIGDQSEKISQIETKVATMQTADIKAGSMFRDYIFPVLLAVGGFTLITIIALSAFQAKMESLQPQPVPPGRQQK
jgi:hypothetical protein